MNRCLLLAFLLGFHSLSAALAATSPTTAAAPAVVFATGQSSLADSKAATQEATGKVLAALGGREPKVVIVFTSRTDLGEELVENLAATFERKRIFGCDTSAPITQEGNFPDQIDPITHGIALLAIAGDCAVTPVWAPVEAESRDPALMYAAHYASGQLIGNKLKEAYRASKAGKFVFTFGCQHVGPSSQYLNAICDQLDYNLPIIGGASGAFGNRKEIIEGRIVTNHNIAILVEGNFSTAFAACEGKDFPKETASILKSLAPAGSPKPAMIFFFEDHLHRKTMVAEGRLKDQSDAIASNSGGIPVFGMYDSGEIGHQNDESSPVAGAQRIMGMSVLPGAR